ncbi:oligosaccharide flippase family protein, partial [Faecalicatena contorta]|uniref:oligosaccharide flippase family protein n=1 Tax=Faecalicatena contorta TaxID=39482 RepID=UPI001F16B0A1
MNKINQLKTGVILTYVNMALGSIIPILYTPVMLRILGKEEYGLYSLSHSVIAYLTLLSFGLGGTIVRYIAKYRAENRKEELEKIAGLAILMYSFLAILVMIAGVFLANNVEIVFHKGLTETELLKIRPLILLMAFNTAISFPISVFSSIVVAYEKYIYRQFVNIFSTVFAPCINLVALFLGFGSIGLAVTTTILQFLMLPMFGGYCSFVLKVRPSFKNLPLHIVKELIGFSLFVFLGSLVDMLFWATDKVILGMLAGTGVVAVYNIGSQFVSMMTNLSTAFSGVLVPKTTVMVAQKASKDDLTNLFIRVGRLQYIIIALAMSGFILYGKRFIILWAGEEYASAYFVALLTMIPLVVPLIQNTGYSILLAQNKHKFRSVVYLIIAIV